MKPISKEIIALSNNLINEVQDKYKVTINTVYTDPLVSTARAEICYVLRSLTKLDRKQVASLIRPNYDQSNIFYCVRRIEERMKYEPSYKEYIDGMISKYKVENKVIDVKIKNFRSKQSYKDENIKLWVKLNVYKFLTSIFGAVAIILSLILFFNEG